MNQAIQDMRSGVVGVFALLMFKSDWRKHFDVSAEGVARSFSGVVLALPAFAFLIFGVNYFYADNVDVYASDFRYTLLDAVISWARFWLLFPVVAAIVALVMDLKDRFASWLVVHNWTVFVLVHIQALLLALYPAGMADAGAIAQTLMLYSILRLFVHWRVAQGAMGLPPIKAAAAAAIPLIMDRLILSVT